MLFLTLLLFDTLIIQLVRQTISISTPFVDRDVSILFSGLPGLMAVETANLCSSQGLHILPFGFTGQRTTERETHIHGYDGKIINIHLYKELSVPAEGLRLLRDIKSKHQNLIIVDYTSPKSALNNLRTYIAAECDFVMGTTGLDYEQIHQEFENAKNYALIAPNMAKQIVAIQMTLSDMALKVPGVFANYDLTIIESHQKSKKDVSGTAKVMLPHLSILNNKEITPNDIVSLRDRSMQAEFGIPTTCIDGHAFHTYSFSNSDASFELKHNVCGRRIYAEGTLDAVLFLDSVRRQHPRPIKRVYNMMDVLKNGPNS